MNYPFCSCLKDEILPASETHVWCASLEIPASRFYKVLSSGEKTQAGRYHSPVERRRFIARRGILRMLLGNYLGIRPEHVQMSYGKNGKPGLDGAFQKTGFYFNASHSEDLALYVFNRENEIGVDIESIKDVPEVEQIVELYFSPGEKVIFRNLPESRKQREFFKYWTRKEAIIKAAGEGLSWPLDKIDISLAPDGPAMFQTPEESTGSALAWHIRDLDPAPGFSAAFALRGPIGQVSCRRWAG